MSIDPGAPITLQDGTLDDLIAETRAIMEAKGTDFSDVVVDTSSAPPRVQDAMDAAAQDAAATIPSPPASESAPVAPVAGAGEGGTGAAPSPPQDPTRLTDADLRAAFDAARQGVETIPAPDPTPTAPPDPAAAAPPTSPTSPPASAAPESTPTPTPATPDPQDFARTQVDANRVFRDYFGADPTAGQLTAIFTAVEQISSLPPDARQIVDALAAGYSVEQIIASLAPPTPPAPAPAPASRAPDPYDPYITDPDSSALPPQVHQEITAMRQEVERLRQIEDRRRAEEEQRMYQMVQHGIDTGFQSWVADHPHLAPEDVLLVQNRARSAGIFPSLVQRGVAPDEAMRRSLNLALDEIPDLRQREVQIAAAQSQPTADEVARQQALAALAHDGGSTQPGLPPGSVPTPPVASPLPQAPGNPQPPTLQTQGLSAGLRDPALGNAIEQYMRQNNVRIGIEM